MDDRPVSRARALLGRRWGAAPEAAGSPTGHRNGFRGWSAYRGRAIAEFVYGIWPYLLLYLILYLVASTLFFATERPHYSWLQSLYFSIGAFAGVTFSDVYPTNGYARVVAGGMVLMFVFLIAIVVTGFGRRAEAVARDEALGLLGTEMKDHYVVLGSDAIAQVATRDLLRQGLRVALLMERPEDVDRLRHLAAPDRLFLTYGPPTEADTLARVNIPESRAVIVSMEDDSLSVIVALQVHAMAPGARLIVSANRPELKSTIRAAGVTFVASPFEMGGRVCASAAFEPDVAAAIDDLTTVAIGSELEEYVLPASAPLVARTFREAVAEVYARTECVPIGYARRVENGTFHPFLAPRGDERLQVGDALILVARTEQRASLRSWLGAAQGR